MAILEQSIEEISGGIEKTIEAGAMGLIQDILQRYQYLFPIKSCIRELASNGLDSVDERETAKKIILKKASVEDFFESRDGEIYKDSKFDEAYYNLEYLSDDPNVYITYYVGDNMEKDKVTITDYGVGLSAQRLLKFFNLGYSTKRLSKQALGKFGIGNKSPLSINSVYTVESRYNGQLFRFNVYSGKVESLIPAFNLETGISNAQIDVNGVKFYALETTEKNGLTITIEAKKHHKSEYIDAVKSQLAYFSNIRLNVVENSNSNPVQFQSEILYEDASILLSNSAYFSKPHILINKVNYGFINFAELELEFKNGNIALKVNPEEVEISPSREALIWTEKTKATVIQRFKDTVISAETIVSKQLTSEEDFYNWWMKSIQINLRGLNQDSLLGRLANLVDLSNIDLKFKGLEQSKPLKFFNAVKLSLVTTSSKLNLVTKIYRDKIQFEGTFINTPLILRLGTTSIKKDRYLLSLYPEGFITLRRPKWFEDPDSVTNYEVFSNLVTPTEAYNLKVMPAKEDIQKLWEALVNSEHTQIYEDIEIPKDFKGTDAEEEIENIENLSEDEIKMANLSAEARRKLTNKIVLNTPRILTDGWTDRLYEWQKLEVATKDIDTWNEDEIYYGNDADRQTLEFVATLVRHNKVLGFPRTVGGTFNHKYMQDSPELTALKINSNTAYRCSFYFNTNLKLLKISRDNVKYFKDFKHINKFFAYKKGTTLTMSNILIKWNTARILEARLHELNFLYNFPFAPNHQKAYTKLYNYVELNFRNMSDMGKLSEINSTAYDSMVKHLNKVQEFQEIVRSGLNPEELVKVSAEYWQSEDITDACAVDYKLIDEFHQLLEWASTIKHLLNCMSILTGFGFESTKRKHVYPDIPDEVHYAIVSYLEEKNVNLQTI